MTSLVDSNIDETVIVELRIWVLVIVLSGGVAMEVMVTGDCVILSV